MSRNPLFRNREDVKVAFSRARKSRDDARKKFLARQRESRRAMLDRARSLATEALQSTQEARDTPVHKHMDVETKLSFGNQGNGKSTGNRSRQYEQRRMRTASSFLYPSWLTPLDVPSDMARMWYVLARPEGKRCLVIAQRGTTISKDTNGKILHRFASALPNGSGPTREAEGFCILDCFFHRKNQTYYILDLLCWRSNLYYDSETEFRFFWLSAKFKECPKLSSPCDCNEFAFAVLPRYLANREGLLTAYPAATQRRNQHGFWQDGLLFYHKKSHYELGPTPLAMLWKDKMCSPYVVHTKDGQTPTAKQLLTLRLDQDRSVREFGGRSLATFSAESLSKAKAKPGALLKFSIDGVHISSDFSKPEHKDSNLVNAYPMVTLKKLSFTSKASPVRILPDTMSKIVFQALARTGDGLTIQELLQHIDGKKDSEAVVSSAPRGLDSAAPRGLDNALWTDESDRMMG